MNAHRPPSDPSRPRRAGETGVAVAGLVSFACVLLGVGAMGGCQASVASQGSRRDVVASYQFRTLESHLGPEVQVLTVRAAAEQALRGRGYSILESTGAADRARVVAKGPNTGDWDRVVVESWLASRSTGISITFEPLGSESQSRAVLDAILNRLGR